MRSATASAWALPVSARCRPGARPGRSLPVVGVLPWRTRSTSVGGGGFGRLGMEVPKLPWRSGPTYVGVVDSLERVTAEIVDCVACPRLVMWRERVAFERRAAFRDEGYWGRPVPGFGDAAARLLVVGLAPAAHGRHRPGRVRPGDRSGGWLV